MYRYIGDTLLYNVIDLLGSVVLFVFNLCQYKRQKEFRSYSMNYIQNAIAKKFPNSKIKIFSGCVFWIILELLIFSVVQYALTGFYNRQFGDMIGTGANYFGKLYHIPFLIVAFCILLWVDPIKQIDLLTPSFPLALFFSKIACFCNGCCNGIQWQNGLFNYRSSLYEFPIQLVEAGLALLIFILLMFIRDRVKPGTLFPIYLLVYSGTRFFSEFLSAKEDVFWILKTYHILCLIGIAFGVVELIVALKLGDQVSEFFTETHYTIPNKKKKS